MNTISNLKNYFIKLLFTLFLLISFTHSHAYIDFPKEQNGSVNDFANIISADDEKKLEKQLKKFYVHDDIKLTIVTMKFPPRKGLRNNAKDITHKIMSDWRLDKVANKKTILMVVSADEKKAVLRGGEGFDNQMPLFNILRKHIDPALKQNDYHNAIYEGTQKIIDETTKEASFLDKVSLPIFIVLAILMYIYLVKNDWISFWWFLDPVDDDYDDDDYY